MKVVCAPFIASWPGRIAPGTTNDLLTSHVDFMAALADLVGVPILGQRDGIQHLC